MILVVTIDLSVEHPLFAALQNEDRTRPVENRNILQHRLASEQTHAFKPGRIVAMPGRKH